MTTQDELLVEAFCSRHGITLEKTVDVVQITRDTLKHLIVDAYDSGIQNGHTYNEMEDGEYDPNF